MSSNDHGHKRFPDRLAFILNNPIRRYIQPPEELLSKLDIGRDYVVVDFGCGPGFLTIPLARLAARVIGVDISSRMLEKAANYAERKGVVIEIIQSDGIEINLADESVDLILLAHVFHEIDDKPRVLGEFFRIMRPSGKLAMVERTRGGSMLAGKLGPPIIYESEVISQMVQAGFNFTATIPYKKGSIVIGQKP